jgi:SAM-dependent methyltransferase
MLLAGAAAAAVAVVRHGRRAARGHQVPGGILIGDAVVYDTLSRLLLGPFVGRIAADIAAVAPDGARVLELGADPAICRPDRSFDLVVSTLSMHHWSDPTAGLAEIGHVLRPGARVRPRSEHSGQALRQQGRPHASQRVPSAALTAMYQGSGG